MGADVVIAANPNGRFDGTFWEERKEELPTLSRSWSERLPHVPEVLRDFFESERDEEQRPQYLDVLAAAIDIMTDGIRRAKLAGDPPHVLLESHLSKLSVLDFHRASEAIEEGRRVVKDNVDAIACAAKL